MVYQLTFEQDNIASQEVEIAVDRSKFGTFRDSLRAPIHRWFTYPAGFSYKAVEETFRIYDIKPGMSVYDPFAGTGTTNIVASQRGIRSFGVEAHPFVWFVAQTKLFWQYNFAELRANIASLTDALKETLLSTSYEDLDLSAVFPELVLKCFSHTKLCALYRCREAIAALPSSPFQNLAKLALTSLLRSIADVETGWPYIAPKKQRVIKNEEDRITIANLVVKKLNEQLNIMYYDIKDALKSTGTIGEASILYGDSRSMQEAIADESIDLAFTSPPYLNNYDYSDRTRLEMYFWGDAKNWGDITQKVRSRLIMSATTQVVRSEYKNASFLSDDFRSAAPALAEFLEVGILAMSKQRLLKGGKKSYDIMVAGYFNDMLQVIRETYRILRPNSHFLLVLGDSAPYGVHIATDTLLGDLGKAIGFSSYSIDVLRTRGDKWKENPQRHKVKLRESILILRK